MRDSPDDAIPWVSAADDAILDPVPTDRSEAVSRRSAPPLAARLLKYGPHAALTAWLFGAAWLVGSYFVGPAPTVVERDAAQKMTAEHHAQKADVEAMRAPQSLSTKAATGLGNAKSRLDATNTEVGPAIAEASGKVEHFRPKSAEKLSKVSGPFDRIGLEIAVLVAAAPAADRSVAAAPFTRRPAQSARHDAFDPSQNPDAPGAPRPLGSIVGAAIANNSAAE